MSRRWLTALAVATLFAVAALFLGQWQWHRHEDKAARAQRINSHYLASPVPLAAAMPSRAASLPRSQDWTVVTATGRYAAQSVMLVRNRPNHGVFGYDVVVPLALADGTSLLVDRGWIPNGPSAAQPSSVPATPAGDITVTGWLRVGERSLGRQMPTGLLASINLAEAHDQTGASLYGAYLIVRGEVRAPGQAGSPAAKIARPQPLEPPDTGEGPHLAYALQWWLGAPMGFVLVLLGARREYLDTQQPLLTHATHRTSMPVPDRSAPRVRKTRIWDEEDG